MTEELNPLEMTAEEIQSKTLEYQMLLQQMDYTARKVAFEVAEKLKELFPDIELPSYDQYKEEEVKAKFFRKAINTLTNRI